jgi:hypothetical protein
MLIATYDTHDSVPVGDIYIHIGRESDEGVPRLGILQDISGMLQLRNQSDIGAHPGVKSMNDTLKGANDPSMVGA